jgi:hypothetical protein
MPEPQVMFLKAANGVSVPFLVVQDEAGNYQMATTLLDADGNQIAFTGAGEIKAVIDSAEVNVDGALTIADGADVTLGSKGDAAVNNPTSSATEIALLKGLLEQLQGTGTGSTPTTLSGSIVPDAQSLPTHIYDPVSGKIVGIDQYNNLKVAMMNAFSALVDSMAVVPFIGTSTAGTWTGGILVTSTSGGYIQIAVDADVTDPVGVQYQTATIGSAGTAIAVATALQTGIRVLGGIYQSVTVSAAMGAYVIASATQGFGSKVRIIAAVSGDIAVALNLTAATGATNSDGTIGTQVSTTNPLPEQIVGTTIASRSSTVTATAGVLTSGASPITNITGLTTPQLKISVDANVGYGDSPTYFNVTLTTTGAHTGALVATAITNAIAALTGIYASVVCTYSGGVYVITSSTTGVSSRVRVTLGNADDCAAALNLTGSTGALAADGNSLLTTSFISTTPGRSILAVKPSVAGILYCVINNVSGYLQSGIKLTANAWWTCDIPILPNIPYNLQFDTAGIVTVEWEVGV